MRFIRRGFFALVPLFTAWVAASSAFAQVPARYVDALARAAYTFFSGDVDADGRVDLLAIAQPGVAIVDLNGLVPLVFRASANFALMSNGGNYSLVVNPTAALRSRSGWRPDTHDAVYGDIAGNGAGGMLVRARVAGGVSFTVATSASTGRPLLLQAIDSTVLGVDLGSAGTTPELRDANRDSRADLIIRRNGVISAVFVADAQGRFAAPADEAGSVVAAWRAFCAALNAGDIASAVSFVSSPSAARYITALQNLGADIARVTQYWSDIAEIRTGPTFSNYLLTQNFEGVERGHMLTFVKENNRWVLEEL